VLFLTFITFNFLGPYLGLWLGLVFLPARAAPRGRLAVRPRA
jgi:hypothetical protein